MPKSLERLIEKARHAHPSPEEREEQRRSFAFGNANIENPRVTRKIIDREAEKMATAPNGRQPAQ